MKTQGFESASAAMQHFRQRIVLWSLVVVVSAILGAFVVLTGWPMNMATNDFQTSALRHLWQMLSGGPLIFSGLMLIWSSLGFITARREDQEAGH